MDTPHESLVLSHERGLLAAVAGNLTTNVGDVDIYDISEDCRHPVLRSSSPDRVPRARERPGARRPHLLLGVALERRRSWPWTSPIPSLPVPIWFGNYDSHGLSISDDGNRAYVAGIDSGLIILDTSEIQARVPNPTVREVARLQWDSMSIPQNAIPVTIKGHPYLVEIDEFGAQSKVGAGRIIDIGDETQPAGGLQPAPRGPPAGELRRPGRRQRGAQPGPGLRRPLLQRAHARRPRDRGVQHDPVGAARVRHPRPAQPARDRLLQRARHPADHPAGRCRPGPQQLGDVEPVVRPGARRDLVLRRPERLLRGASDERVWRASRARRGERRAWRAARRSDRATSAASGWATPAAGCCALPVQPVRKTRRSLPLLRQAQLGPRDGGLLAPRSRRAGDHDRPACTETAACAPAARCAPCVAPTPRRRARAAASTARTGPATA